MEQQEKQTVQPAQPEELDMKNVIRSVIQEFVDAQKSRSEPAYKAELVEERKRREQLEHRLNELAEENRRSRQRAEEAERSSVIRSELQRLGVTKVDLAFKAVKDDIVRTEDGSLVARSNGGETSVREYLAGFVGENPELLPARIPGGSGTTSGQRQAPAPAGSVDLDKIRPGMDPEELNRVRQEISRIALQSMRGV